MTSKTRRARTEEVIGEILAERTRQVEKEGFSEEHDDRHDGGELAAAAAAYAMAPYPIYLKTDLADGVGFKDCFPWGPGYDGRKKHSYKRCLVIAGALIVAELERIGRDRA